MSLYTVPLFVDDGSLLDGSFCSELGRTVRVLGMGLVPGFIACSSLYFLVKRTAGFVFVSANRIETVKNISLSKRNILFAVSCRTVTTLYLIVISN